MPEVGVKRHILDGYTSRHSYHTCRPKSKVAGGTSRKAIPEVKFYVEDDARRRATAVRIGVVEGDEDRIFSVGDASVADMFLVESRNYFQCKSKAACLVEDAGFTGPDAAYGRLD